MDEIDPSTPNTAASPQILSFPKKAQIPWWSWIIRIWGFCVVVFCFGFSIWYLKEVKHPFGWMTFVVAALVMVIGGVREIKELLNLNSVMVFENGVQRRKRGSIVFYKWEDVRRYEPYSLDFSLFFNNGDRIRFFGEMKNFKELKTFILENIERIGTYEDGRHVPRELFSVSNKTLAWILAAIVLMVLIVLMISHVH